MKKLVSYVLILAMALLAGCGYVVVEERSGRIWDDSALAAEIAAMPEASASMPENTPKATETVKPEETMKPEATVESEKTAEPEKTVEPEKTAEPEPMPRPTPVSPMAVPEPVPTADNRLTLGSTGAEVKEIQGRLRVLGFMTGSADGSFGPVTERAVAGLREYMRELALIETVGEGIEELLPGLIEEDADGPAPAMPQLPPEDAEPMEVVDGEDPDAAEFSGTDGVVDDTVRDLLLREQFQVYQETVKRGSQGREVERLQNRLNTLRYLYGGTDGQFGRKTETAVAVFQKTNSLPQTGIADEETQRLLFSEAAKDAPIPANPYVLKVSVSDQKVYAYAYDVGTGSYSRLVRSMKCSTGLKGTPTPYGTFSSVGPVARWGYFPKWDVYAQYLFRITGGILFHSVLYRTSSESSLIQGSVSKLGSRASHGCVRLSVEDAKWIYNNCPAGTTVTVY